MKIFVFRNLANTAEGVKACHGIERLNRISYCKNYKNSHIFCCESFGHLSSLFRPISLLYLSQKCLSGWKTRDQSDGRDLVIKTHKKGWKRKKLKLTNKTTSIYINLRYLKIYVEIKMVLTRPRWSYDDLMVIWW